MENSSGEGRELLRSPRFYCPGGTENSPRVPQILGTGGVELDGEVGCGWMDGKPLGCGEAVEPLGHGCSGTFLPPPLHVYVNGFLTPLVTLWREEV